jgi:hypothetical protein
MAQGSTAKKVEQSNSSSPGVSLYHIALTNTALTERNNEREVRVNHHRAIKMMTKVGFVGFYTPGSAAEPKREF